MNIIILYLTVTHEIMTNVLLYWFTLDEYKIVHTSLQYHYQQHSKKSFSLFDYNEDDDDNDDDDDYHNDDFDLSSSL